MPASSATETAGFTPIVCYTLSVSYGTGGTAATAVPSNSVGCSSGSYLSGASITLTATAGTGYTFSGWTGTSSSSSNPWSYTMPASSATETAGFTAIPCYTLSVSYGTGGSSATSVPSNSVGCSSGTYVSGDSVTLTATAASGYVFNGWTGTSSSSSNPWSYTMPASAATETAGFISAPCYTLAVSCGGSGCKSATASPTHSSGCSTGSYVSGASITLTATGRVQYSFDSWQGTYADYDDPWYFTMPSSAVTEQATFDYNGGQ
jgi:uncharacterized repeat protein (TIGR02543 family)